MAISAKAWYDQTLKEYERQEAARKAGLKTYYDETSAARLAERDRAVGNINTLRGKYEESLNPLRQGYQSEYDTSAAQAEKGREQRIQDIMLASRLAENSDATRLQNLSGMGEAETLKSWRESDLIKQRDTATSETNTQVQNLKAALDKQLAELEAQRQDRLLAFDAQAAQADTDYASALTSLTSDYNLRLNDSDYQRMLNDLYSEYLDRLAAEQKSASRSSGSGGSNSGGGFIDMSAASEGKLTGAGVGTSAGTESPGISRGNLSLTAEEQRMVNQLNSAVDKGSMTPTQAISVYDAYRAKPRYTFDNVMYRR